MNDETLKTIRMAGNLLAFRGYEIVAHAVMEAADDIEGGARAAAPQDVKNTRDLTYIHDDDLTGLEQQVREMYMHDDWEPVGGVATRYYKKSGGPSYIQLMVRK